MPDTAAARRAKFKLAPSRAESADPATGLLIERPVGTALLVRGLRQQLGVASRP